MEKVSIIIPVYNIEKYVAKCLDSVTNQSYPNLEIIIVDDGSTDNSLKICKEYQKKDKRIKIIHQENKGLSGARNRGFKESTGDFIWFVDGDDYIEYNSLEVIKSYLKKNDIIVFNYKKINGKKELKIKNKKNDENINIRYMLSCVTAWNKVFKREILEGESFPEGYIYEDIYLIPSLGLKTSKIIFIDEYLYNYVNREHSITNSNFKFKDKIYVMNHVYDKLHLNNKDEAEFIYINNLILPSIVDKVQKGHKYNLKQINDIAKEKFPQYYKNKYWTRGLLRKMFLYCFYKEIFFIPLTMTYFKFKFKNLRYKNIKFSKKFI